MRLSLSAFRDLYHLWWHKRSRLSSDLPKPERLNPQTKRNRVVYPALWKRVLEVFTSLWLTSDSGPHFMLFGRPDLQPSWLNTDMEVRLSETAWHYIKRKYLVWLGDVHFVMSTHPRGITSQKSIKTCLWIDKSPLKRGDRESDVWINKDTTCVDQFSCVISSGNLLLFILWPINIWYDVVVALCNSLSVAHCGRKALALFWISRLGD